jgi:hypothetical protein
MTLKSVCGAHWCEQNYTEFHPKKEETFFNHRHLATDVISKCQQMGLYKENSERRFGVWPGQDNAALYVNGDELWRNNGEVLNTRFYDGKVYPKSGDVGFDAATPSASKEDVIQVLEVFGQYKWRCDMVPEMLLGWFVCATLAPALERRPHCYVTAPAGVGKTVLLNTMSAMLGPLAYKATGLQSKAALYQSIGGTPRAVILDEAEADSSNRKWKDMLEIARSSYSREEEDAGIVVGGQSGTAKSYRFYAPFFAASIVPGCFEAADLSRWCIFEATGRITNTADKPLSREQARELGARLAAKAVRQWSVLQASLEVIRHAVMLQGGDARLADTIGPLLAGYWVLVSDSAATPDDANTLVGLCGLNRHINQREETDQVRCLEALLSRVMALPEVVSGFLIRQPMSIGEAIAKICSNPTGSLELQNRLTQLGLRVTMMKGRWAILVANSPEHAELRKLFRGTKWQHGGWPTTLRRLPGGEESTQRLGAGYKASKVTMFDVPAEFLPANDESDELLAA